MSIIICRGLKNRKAQQAKGFPQENNLKPKTICQSLLQQVGFKLMVEVVFPGDQ